MEPEEASEWLELIVQAEGLALPTLMAWAALTQLSPRTFKGFMGFEHEV